MLDYQDIVSVPYRGSMSFYISLGVRQRKRLVSVPYRGSMSFYYIGSDVEWIFNVSVPYRGSISFYATAWIAFLAMLFHWICGGKEKHRKSMKKLLFKSL